MRSQPSQQPSSRFFERCADKIRKNKKLTFILIALVLACLSVILYQMMNKPKPRTYSDYFETAEEVIEIDQAATDLSQAWKGQRAQLGDEAYDALVLGIPVGKDSEFYEAQQQTFGASVNEAYHAMGVVEEHETQIKAWGGIVSGADVAKTNTGQIEDPVARKLVDKALGIAPVLNGDEELARNRLLAAWQE